MNDTSPSVTIRFNRLIMEKTGEERLLMGCSMYDAARRIAKSAIMQRYPAISPDGIKREIFLRFYAGEFDEIRTEKILDTLGTPSIAEGK